MDNGPNTPKWVVCPIVQKVAFSSQRSAISFGQNPSCPPLLKWGWEGIGGWYQMRTFMRMGVP